VQEQVIIVDMLTKYPMFCETECLAWSKQSKRCNCLVMSETMCAWDIDKVRKRITDRTKLNGPKWWKKVKGVKVGGDEDS
jgi:hypothetical protein